MRQFRETLEKTGIRAPCAHAAYLINLASPDNALWQRSLDAFVIELQRADALGLFGLVVHPGSAVGISEEEGLERVVEALDEAHRRTAGIRTLTLLENTAGQGSNLGHRFEHLAWILEHAADGDRLGVCIDTCHLFAAGYPLGTRKEYRATFAQFDRLIGIERIRAFHLNDSKRPFASRVDRHAHIGHGELGLEAFRLVLNDRRWRNLPMYLETPKGDHDGTSWDAVNLETLRSLMRKPRRSNPKTARSRKR